MRGLFRLLWRYVFGSETIMWIIIMPLMLFGILGEAMIFGRQLSHQQQIDNANSFIAGISGTGIISSALFLLPMTIVEFKNSVLMKRIGATNTKPWQFVLIVIGLFVFESSFSFFYSRGIACLFFGSKLGWGIGFMHNVFLGFGYIIMATLVSIAIGLVLAAVTHTPTQTTTVSNILYFPIMLMSGGFIPVNLIYNSNVLKGITWLNPFKYSMEPYLSQQGAFTVDHNVLYSLSHWENILFPCVSALITIICSIFAAKKLKRTS